VSQEGRKEGRKEGTKQKKRKKRKKRKKKTKKILVNNTTNPSHHKVLIGSSNAHRQRVKEVCGTPQKPKITKKKKKTKQNQTKQNTRETLPEAWNCLHTYLLVFHGSSVPLK
jgi:hypothetical protein